MDMWMDGYLDVYRGTVHCSILYLYIVEDNATCVENAEWRGGGDGGVRLWMGWYGKMREEGRKRGEWIVNVLGGLLHKDASGLKCKMVVMEWDGGWCNDVIKCRMIGVMWWIRIGGDGDDRWWHGDRIVHSNNSKMQGKDGRVKFGNTMVWWSGIGSDLNGVKCKEMGDGVACGDDVGWREMGKGWNGHMTWHGVRWECSVCVCMRICDGNETKWDRKEIKRNCQGICMYVCMYGYEWWIQWWMCVQKEMVVVVVGRCKWTQSTARRQQSRDARHPKTLTSNKLMHPKTLTN